MTPATSAAPLTCAPVAASTLQGLLAHVWSIPTLVARAAAAGHPGLARLVASEWDREGLGRERAPAERVAAIVVPARRAAERLAALIEAGDRAQFLDRIAQWSQAADPVLSAFAQEAARPGPAGMGWFEQLEAAHGRLDLLLDWSLAVANSAEVAARRSVALAGDELDVPAGVRAERVVMVERAMDAGGWALRRGAGPGDWFAAVDPQERGDLAQRLGSLRASHAPQGLLVVSAYANTPAGAKSARLVEDAGRACEGVAVRRDPPPSVGVGWGEALEGESLELGRRR